VAKRDEVIDVIASGCLANRLRALSRGVTRVFEEELRAEGVDLTVAQMNILVGIGKTGPVAGGDLARKMFIEKSTFSRNLKRLLARDWVRSAPTLEDARVQELTITAAGRRMLKQAFPAWRRAQDKTTAALGATTPKQVHRLYERLATLED
jgi:DNA-binding MarR family transcriptional regulator